MHLKYVKNIKKVLTVLGVPLAGKSHLFFLKKKLSENNLEYP